MAKQNLIKYITDISVEGFESSGLTRKEWNTLEQLLTNTSVEKFVEGMLDFALNTEDWYEGVITRESVVALLKDFIAEFLETPSKEVTLQGIENTIINFLLRDTPNNIMDCDKVNYYRKKLLTYLLQDPDNLAQLSHSVSTHITEPTTEEIFITLSQRLDTLSTYIRDVTPSDIFVLSQDLVTSALGNQLRETIEEVICRKSDTYDFRSEVIIEFERLLKMYSIEEVVSAMFKLFILYQKPYPHWETVSSIDISQMINSFTDFSSRYEPLNQ